MKAYSTKEQHQAKWLIRISNGYYEKEGTKGFLFFLNVLEFHFREQTADICPHVIIAIFL